MRTTTVLISMMASIVVWVAPGCPIESCSASTSSEPQEILLDEGEMAVRFEVFLFSDLPPADSNSDTFNGDAVLDLTISLDDAIGDGSSSAQITIVSLDGLPIEGDLDRTLESWDDGEVGLSVYDALGEECAWGTTCETVLAVDLVRQVGTVPLTGTLEAKYKLEGQNYDCEKGNFGEIDLEVVITEV